MGLLDQRPVRRKAEQGQVVRLSQPGESGSARSATAAFALGAQLRQARRSPRRGGRIRRHSTTSASRALSVTPSVAISAVSPSASGRMPRPHVHRHGRRPLARWRPGGARGGPGPAPRPCRPRRTARPDRRVRRRAVPARPLAGEKTITSASPAWSVSDPAVRERPRQRSWRRRRGSAPAPRRGPAARPEWRALVRGSGWRPQAPASAERAHSAQGRRPSPPG